MPTALGAGGKSPADIWHGDSRLPPLAPLGKIRRPATATFSEFWQSLETTFTESSRARIAAEVTLALLEAIRSTDRPREFLEDEDFHRTMPRRFGLSAVVDRQIDLYRERVRKKVKLNGEEFAEFMQLVIRRPDSAQIFRTMGARLADNEVGRRRWWLPRFVRLYQTRKRIERSLRRLFGRRIGGFASGPFVFEVSASPFVQVDGSGDACEVITGFCRHALAKAVDPRMTVTMRSCETNGDRVCSWVAELET